MKKNQPGKLVKQPLLSGASTVCLLFLTLWSGSVAAEVPEAPPVPNRVEAPAPAQQEQTALPTQQDKTAIPAQQNQTADPAQQLPTADEQAAIEEENTKVANALEELLKSMKMDDFEYQVEERPDPFMPFISEKIIQSTDSESGERLPGMRQLEPGQLSLTAILFTEVNPLAMVEDSSHKGYVIRRGTRIGKSGIVTDILPNSVVIKQLSYSTGAEKKYTTVEMILRKEGEK